MRPSALLVVALALSGCTAFAPHADEASLERAGGGGGVVDTPAVFQAFSADHTTVENDGTQTVIVSGTVFDANTETNIATIRPMMNGSVGAGVNHTVTSAERSAVNEPTTWPSDNLRVWTGASSIDGVLYFRWRVPIAARHQPGYDLLNACVSNPTGVTVYAGGVSLNVTNWSEVTVAASPVLLDGSASTSSWGAWNASPGATNASATNYLQVTNTGWLARPLVSIDFNELSFAGVSDAAYLVPIDRNLAFAWWDDTTPATTAPSEGTYVFTDSANGAVSVQPSAHGDIIYLTYRVKAIPATLPVQTYAATFTATDLGGDDGASAHPDLIVESITPSNPAPKAPAPISFAVTLRNVGTLAMPAGSITTTVMNGPTNLGTVVYNGSLAVGASVTLTTPAQPSFKGTYTPVATVDATNTVVETVETNNARSITLVVS